MKAEAKLAAAIGVGFGLAYPLILLLQLPHWATIAAKGACVGFLALAAMRSARSPDGWLLAAVLALGATGDVLLEIRFAAGAAAFALGHLVAILLYLRNRRPNADAADLAAAGMLLALSASIPFLLLKGLPEQVGFSAYGLLLGAMAASAWFSAFPRRLVAAGACLFLVSDMLIAARIGMGTRPAALGVAIWYLYFAGQAMIFLGVSRSLATRAA